MTESTPPRLLSRPSERDSRALRWLMVVGVAAMVLIGIVLLLLLTVSTNNRELYERYYTPLLLLNAGIASVLLLVIVWIVWRLVVRVRRGKFGSRLLVKLAAIFALVGFVPGLLIYFVSYQFVSRSIESWFDVKVEGALDAGLSLGRATLEAMSSDLATKTRAASAQLADVPDVAAGIVLERLREQLAATDLVLWTAQGQAVASAGQSRFQLAPERPSLAQLRSARSQRVVTSIEGLDEPGLGAVTHARIRALAFVAPSAVGLLAEPRYLQVTQSLPPALVANAIAVQEANREYQERALARDGLRRMYIGTLTLSLFLAVVGAVVLAVLLGNQLARPLLVLAAGVREVAAGDLSPKPALQGRDELGGLTRAFADMTSQLAEARSAVEQGMAQVVAARAHLQAILDNLTAGVLVLDAQGAIQVANPGAIRILKLPAQHLGRTLGDLEGLASLGQRVAARFAEFEAEQPREDHWQQTVELDERANPHAPSGGVTLVLRGALLPAGERLLVFDDISEVVSAQRARAWGEVARRLAHEIKNPLTPIQLSAERLQHKLAERLPESDRAVLVKSVRVIVEQVDAMKRLVNEFRDYARLPAAELKALDLNQLVSDVLPLYQTEGQREGGGHEPAAAVPVRAELDARCPPILGDAQQLRQVIHNLLQNAQDATEGQPQREVCLRTRWSESARRVRLIVTDTGGGFPDAILRRAFEPYVTTKPRGTGLGLAVVKKIADEHGARVELSNRTADGRVLGAQVSVSFAVATSQHSAAPA